VRKENQNGIIANKLIDVSRQEQSAQREPSFSQAQEVESVGKRKVAFPEQPQFNYRVPLAQFPNECRHQSDDRNGEECHDFKAGKTESDQQNSQVVNLQSSCLACCFSLSP